MSTHVQNDLIFKPLNFEEVKICIVGLGYVGLPLAVAFGKKAKTVGYDINENRVWKLSSGIDDTLEISANELKESSYLKFSSSIRDITDCDIYIVTVPTPIDKHNEPDLFLIKRASETIGQCLKKGNVVIYESTVYPGTTEEVCVPILEKNSSLDFNHDFFVGYSPERINPGDKKHRLQSIIKVVSGSTFETLIYVDNLYSSIINAGTYRAPSIKVAEAAKVIENTQRDLNIALMNELSMIFEKLDIDTDAVLKAAETKWNFLSFRPGLVGGHCIGVDPYYLTYKAKKVGYDPKLILAGRQINDQMASYVAHKMISALVKKNIVIKDAKILVMGLTFKENCPDLRNSKVVDLINILENQGISVSVHDPVCSEVEAMSAYNIKLTKDLVFEEYDGVILCVAHDIYRKMPIAVMRARCKKNCIIYDLKHIFDSNEIDLRL